MKTKLEVALETLLFYHKEPDQRGVKIDLKGYQSSCDYLTQDGRRCAVGRCADINQDWYDDSLADIASMEDVLRRLKPEYAHLRDEVEFWEELQIFHDGVPNWDDEGVTKEGLGRFIEYVLVLWCDVTLDWGDNANKSKTEIILETVCYYHKDPSRRGLDKNNRCLYVTVDGKRCAMGRCTDLLHSDRGHFFHDAVEALKSEYKGHREHRDNFWSKLQLFHDTYENWTNAGLTNEGMKHLIRLIIEFNK